MSWLTPEEEKSTHIIIINAWTHGNTHPETFSHFPSIGDPFLNDCLGKFIIVNIKRVLTAEAEFNSE